MANGFNLIDTTSFDSVISRRDKILRDCEKIKTDYNSIVNSFIGGSTPNWRGCGADAFSNDATRVKHSIDGVADILRTMTDTLRDCRNVIDETDRTVGDFNRNPFKG